MSEAVKASKNRPLIEQLRAAAASDPGAYRPALLRAATVIESLETALVKMYREHQKACAIAEEANDRADELLARIVATTDIESRPTTDREG